MILGIGVDIVEINRVKAIYDRWGDRFCQKILCHVEQADLKDKKNKVRFIAKKFCAKEALSKALGTGMKSGVHFPQFNIRHDKQGAPYVILSGEAQKIYLDKSVSHIHISISDEQDYVVAFAVLSTEVKQ